MIDRMKVKLSLAFFFVAHLWKNEMNLGLKVKFPYEYKIRKWSFGDKIGGNGFKVD